MKKTATPSTTSKAFIPFVLAEGYDANGLYFCKIKLRTRTITITEPKYGVDEIRTQYAREVLAMDIPDVNRKNALLLTYSALAAVSSGNVPKASQLHEMADADVKFWIEKAHKIAPQLFSWMDDLEGLSLPEKKAALKKKGK